MPPQLLTCTLPSAWSRRPAAFRTAGLLALFSLGTVCQATPIYYLATGQTGAQTQIDVSHSSSWVMTPNTAFAFGGGLFTMKQGQSTVAPVTLALFQGTSAAGSLLATATLTATNFCAQVANCGQYAYHAFTMSVSLQAGVSYFAQLTSPADNTQSLAYFIKNDSFFISDQNGTAIVPQPVTFGTQTVTPMPEPGSALLVLLGLAMLRVQRIQRVR